jgi:hypothetical protein
VILILHAGATLDSMKETLLSSYNQTYEDVYTFPITWLDPGDTLLMKFWGYTAAAPDDLYNEPYNAFLHWNIREVTVLHDGQSSLHPSTWGEIKSLFI